MNSGCWLIVWFCCCIFLSSCCTDESKIEVYNNKTILPLEGTLREQTNTADALDCGEKCCDTICDIALFSKDAETNCFLYFCEGLCQENTINGTTMLVKKSAGFGKFRSLSFYTLIYYFFQLFNTTLSRF